MADSPPEYPFRQDGYYLKSISIEDDESGYMWCVLSGPPTTFNLPWERHLRWEPDEKEIQVPKSEYRDLYPLVGKQVTIWYSADQKVAKISPYT